MATEEIKHEPKLSTNDIQSLNRFASNMGELMNQSTNIKSECKKNISNAQKEVTDTITELIINNKKFEIKGELVMSIINQLVDRLARVCLDEGIKIANCDISSTLALNIQTDLLKKR